MRQHFNRGCISHTTPDGKSLFGRIEWLLRKLNNGTLTPEEHDELAEMLAKQRKRIIPQVNRNPKEIVVSLGGTWKVRISFEKYKTTYSDFKVVEEIW